VVPNGVVDKLVLLLRLHHTPSLLTHLLDKLVDAGLGAEVDQIEGVMDRDERAGAADAGAAVHHDGTDVVQQPRKVIRRVDELADAFGRIGGPEIGPLLVVQMEDLACLLLARQKKPSESEMLVIFLIELQHLDVAETVGAPGIEGPINICLHLSTFEQAREHDDYRALLFPYHSPEIAECRKDGGLAGDVFTFEDEIRVDVIGSFLALVFQRDSGLFEGEDVRVPILMLRRRTQGRKEKPFLLRFGETAVIF